MINYTELSARISRETLAMQRALGENSGKISNAAAMTVSGLVLGFTKGWSLALCILGLSPVLMVLVTIFGKIMVSGIT